MPFSGFRRLLICQSVLEQLVHPLVQKRLFSFVGTERRVFGLSHHLPPGLLLELVAFLRSPTLTSHASSFLSWRRCRNGAASRTREAASGRAQRNPATKLTRPLSTVRSLWAAGRGFLTVAVSVKEKGLPVAGGLALSAAAGSSCKPSG